MVHEEENDRPRLSDALPREESQRLHLHGQPERGEYFAAIAHHRLQSRREIYHQNPVGPSSNPAHSPAYRSDEARHIIHPWSRSGKYIDQRHSFAGVDE